ncbi:MAG: sodium-independent anion transporter [Deltaproteobacteria bacterium]
MNLVIPNRSFRVRASVSLHSAQYAQRRCRAGEGDGAEGATLAERNADPLILRVDAQFYFGNVTFLKRSLDQLCRERPGLRTIILDASGINQLDSSALDALLEIDRALQQQELRLLLAEVKGPVRDVLERSGWLARLRSEQRVFLRVHDAVLSLADAHRERLPLTPQPGAVGELA